MYVFTHGGPMSILNCFLDNKDLSHLWEKETPNLSQVCLTPEQILRLIQFKSSEEKVYIQHSYPSSHWAMQLPNSEDENFIALIEIFNIKLAIIRHGETIYNTPRKRIQGQSPNQSIILSERGRKEIKKALAHEEKPDVIICSPLLRCKQTVEEWFEMRFEEIPCKKYIMEDLKEVDTGKLTEQFVDELSLDHKQIWDQ